MLSEIGGGRRASPRINTMCVLAPDFNTVLSSFLLASFQRFLPMSCRLGVDSYATREQGIGSVDAEKGDSLRFCHKTMSPVFREQQN